MEAIEDVNGVGVAHPVGRGGLSVVVTNQIGVLPLTQEQAEDIADAVAIRLGLLSEYEPDLGDTVRLRSGGPEMTVTKFLTDDVVTVTWNPKDDEKHSGKLHSLPLPTVALELVRAAR